MDPNGHLNNAVHLDWLDEAVIAADGAADLGRFPRRYGAEYLQALQLGVGSTVAAWRDADSAGWHGTITRDDGVVAGRSRLLVGAAAS